MNSNFNLHTLLEIALFFKAIKWLKANGYINYLRWRGESNYFKNRSIYKKDSSEVVSKKSMIEKDSEGSEKKEKFFSRVRENKHYE